MARAGSKTKDIAMELGRTPKGVYSQGRKISNEYGLSDINLDWPNDNDGFDTGNSRQKDAVKISESIKNYVDDFSEPKNVITPQPYHPVDNPNNFTFEVPKSLIYVLAVIAAGVLGVVAGIQI